MRRYTDECANNSIISIGDDNMASFDKQRALEIIESGDSIRIEGMLDDIARRINTRKYGLVFENGGGRQSVPC